ncbi:MAG: hypothetical protein FWD17_17560 [Polyangiaceae bacterium]|nr:hypothetical protein [Polyangiaceae bacterium]
MRPLVPSDVKNALPDVLVSPAGWNVASTPVSSGVDMFWGMVGGIALGRTCAALGASSACCVTAATNAGLADAGVSLDWA